MLSLVFENVFVFDPPPVPNPPRPLGHSTLPLCTLSYCRHRLDVNQLPSSDDLIHSRHLVTHLLQEAFILLLLKPACLSLPVACLFVCAAPPLLVHQAVMVKATTVSRLNLTANLRHLSITAQRVLLAVFLQSVLNDLICHWPVAL